MKATTMIVKCIKSSAAVKKYGVRINKSSVGEGITPNFDYVVISIEIGLVGLERLDDDLIRYWIVDDRGAFMPFNAHEFVVIDHFFPPLWEVNLIRNSVVISHPNWAKHGYIEDYFENQKISKKYKRIIKKIFEESLRKKRIKTKLNLSVKNTDFLIGVRKFLPNPETLCRFIETNEF